jgi:hypothetical protein
MAIFAVVPLDQTALAALRPAIEREFHGKNFMVGFDHWLVSANATAQEVSGKLGITATTVGQAMVYNVGGYFGYAPSTTWEWLKSNMTTGSPSG